MTAPTEELVEDPRASIPGICGEQEVVGGRVMFCKRDEHDTRESLPYFQRDTGRDPSEYHHFVHLWPDSDR